MKCDEIPCHPTQSVSCPFARAATLRTLRTTPVAEQPSQLPDRLLRHHCARVQFRDGYPILLPATNLLISKLNVLPGRCAWGKHNTDRVCHSAAPGTHRGLGTPTAGGGGYGALWLQARFRRSNVTVLLSLYLTGFQGLFQLLKIWQCKEREQLLFKENRDFRSLHLVWKYFMKREKWLFQIIKEVKILQYIVNGLQDSFHWTVCK